MSTLPPKPPPTVPADEVEGVGGHVQNLGAGVDREEQRLRRGVDDVAAVGVGRGDRAVGLGRRVLDRRHLVALLQHVIGGRERRIGVAETQALVIVDLVIGECVLWVGLVDHGRAGLERVLDVEHRRQHLVVDLDLGNRLERLALAVGNDGDDRLALVADLVDRQRRLVVLAEIDQAQQRVEIDRHVGAADDPAHAGRALGLGGVDTANPCMRLGRADDLQVQHALKFMVVEIARRARDVAEHVLALRPLADLFQIIVALVGEDVLAQFQHDGDPQALARLPEAARMASMMGS
ncbi:hypothetical protein ACVI8L_001378 [Bradyrhizobium diazoefficiens]